MVTVLTHQEAEQAIKQRGLRWKLADGALERVVKCHRFSGALAFVNAVGAIAEEADHHPDIAISWDTVTLRLVTHSAGGITQADLDMAAAIDAMAAAGTIDRE